MDADCSGIDPKITFRRIGTSYQAESGRLTRAYFCSEHCPEVLGCTAAVFQNFKLPLTIRIEGGGSLEGPFDVHSTATAICLLRADSPNKLQFCWMPGMEGLC